MKRFLVAAVSAALFVVVGCQKNNPDDPKMMAQDDCAHCAGVQKATSDGKCPVCNMDVKPKSMSIDVCDHCPGVQTATTTDGKCAACAAKSSAGPTTRPGT